MYPFCSGRSILHHYFRRRLGRVAPVAVHRLRRALRHHAPHQHLPLLRHDLLVHQERDHREGALHLRRLLHLRLAVRVSAKIKEELWSNIE